MIDISSVISYLVSCYLVPDTLSLSLMAYYLKKGERLISLSGNQPLRVSLLAMCHFLSTTGLVQRECTDKRTWVRPWFCCWRCWMAFVIACVIFSRFMAAKLHNFFLLTNFFLQFFCFF